MTVTVYSSTDGSAPVLTGSVGTLLTVLDAVLVNGYGSKSAAGWTKPFSNSGNIGCYQNSAVDGTGFCLNVNDAAPGTGGAREARMTGFETLTALSTGTGQFPTLTLMPIGTGNLVCRKSTTADGTARAWTIIADDTVFYLFTESGDFPSMPGVGALFFMFGDIFSFKASDAYRCAIIGQNAEGSAYTTASNGFPWLHAAGAAAANGAFLTQTMAGHYMARHWTGIGGCIPVGKHIDHAKMGAFGSVGTSAGTTAAGNALVGIGFNNTFGGPLNFPFPNGPDGALWLSPIWLHHSNAVRGYLKGLWAPLHDRPLNHNDTYSGTSNMSGKSLLVQQVPIFNGVTSYPAQVHIETSSTWS